MRILVTNDDGIYAPGIKILAKALEAVGAVTVVAPDRNHSGASNALTLNQPVRVNKVADNQYSIQGTPTDCVHLAICGLIDEPFDLVVSGINDGSNLGDDIFYSGTVAAAIEGRLMGLPAIAISMGSSNPRHFETAGDVAVRLVKKMGQHMISQDTILNVNVPDLPFDDIAGFDVVRMGSRHRAEPIIREVDPRGHAMYWVGLPGAEDDAGPGTDFYAINENKVSVTPIQLDLTSYKSFEAVADWVDEVSV